VRIRQQAPIAPRASDLHPGQRFVQAGGDRCQRLRGVGDAAHRPGTGLGHARDLLDVARDLAGGAGLLARGQFDAVDAACAKLLTTELQGKVMDECLQFFGGWGYMLEYPIARAFVDARMTRLGGGAAEVMRQIIANSILPRVKRPL
jgi:hypothetical protein